MAPHDLLCKWCSTFVGKGKKFCSIFCESRYTRSKRRKLAFKRPVYSSVPHTEKEYESPRSNKTAPARKESFLEDVITAIEKDKPSPERDKRRPDDDTSANAAESPASTDKIVKSESSQKTDSSDKAIPKLDLSSPKETKDVREKTNVSAREKREIKGNTKYKVAEIKDGERNKSATKSKEFGNGNRSKTHTILVHKNESRIPVRTSHDKDIDLNRTDPIKKSAMDDALKTELKARRLSNTNDKMKLDSEKGAMADNYDQAVQIHKSKLATELEKKTRSSGYGNPVNPRLRPMALKPRSATLSSSTAKQKRESASAKSTKSSTFTSEESRPIGSGRDRGKWELIATTITEESHRAEITNGNTSLEDEDPTPKNSPRKTGKTDSSTQELAKIHEILREESTHSDLLSQTELQLRLSSIKKKVEVRKRGRDSRSSYSSDLDASFQDSTMDLTTDRDFLNTSTGGAKPTNTSRASARSNITRISKQFTSNDD